MAFTDHKITAFTHKISDLADQPNLPPDELKARFDACPEELRQAVNAICDDAAVLDTKVSGIVSGSFEGAVDKSILSADLAAELDAKATQTALSAETSARTSADAALNTRVTSVETAMANNIQFHYAGYIGDGASSRDIYIGWRPSIVLLVQSSCYMLNGSDIVGGMISSGSPIHSGSEIGAEMTATGFRVYQKTASKLLLNTNQMSYRFFALR